MPLTDLSPWAVAGLTWVALLALLALVCLVLRLLPAPAADTQVFPAVATYEGRHRDTGANPRPLYAPPPGFRRAVRDGLSIGWRDWRPPFTPAGGIA